jgi:hypothetical protein
MGVILLINETKRCHWALVGAVIQQQAVLGASPTNTTERKATSHAEESEISSTDSKLRS